MQIISGAVPILVFLYASFIRTETFLTTGLSVFILYILDLPTVTDMLKVDLPKYFTSKLSHVIVVSGRNF